MTPARTVAVGVLLAAIALPFALRAAGWEFYLGVATRILIFAVAATSLNLLLGHGGMVSLGHAAFMGLGSYVSGVLLSEGQQGVVEHVFWVLAITGVASLAIGAVSLRTRGVYFIMITLAFAQMLFYLANSLKGYGGDEGLRVRPRVLLPFGGDLHDASTVYYTSLVVLVACLVALWRFSRSRTGLAVRALRDDELRAEALGLPTFRWKLAVFVVAGMVAGVAGALAVNLQGYVSPNNLHWTQSGTLLVMVILGGAGSLWGGVAGAAVLLLLQEVLSAYTQYWAFWTGWVLLLAVLFARHGIAGLWRPASAARDASEPAAKEATP